MARSNAGKDSSPNSNQPLDAITDFLEEPDNYPEPTGKVTVKDTHLSRVFLTDDYVYKLKKSLRYDFLDFSSLQARLRNCETEVVINSELAPSVYQGVVVLAQGGSGGFELGGSGEPVDYLVKMRRLPDSANLEAQLEDGGPDRAEVDAAATRLARFYRDRPVAGGVDPEHYRSLCRERRDELRDLPLSPGDDLDRLHDRLQRALRDHGDALARRHRVDVHGDLRPQHVYLGEDPVFIDRLEFNSELRLLDPVEELVFFQLECQRLSHGWVGERFLRTYCELSGDQPPQWLPGLYQGYRGLLWALLSARHLERNDTRKPWAEIARDYLRRGLAAMKED
ncbi:MAG: hypothetical protein R3280_06500 [Marinobacter sp.]|uniref:hypothetical protein n=1 Tax=Marinobacter sp. TaxID=50741 RepID=UPI00299E01C9|nr:hypothetical protein [Marinobacter sp.]MDX1634266.1 hypothetical protein [Marinobacter sp.]